MSYVLAVQNYLADFYDSEWYIDVDKNLFDKGKERAIELSGTPEVARTLFIQLKKDLSNVRQLLLQSQLGNVIAKTKLGQIENVLITYLMTLHDSLWLINDHEWSTETGNSLRMIEKQIW